MRVMGRVAALEPLRALAALEAGRCAREAARLSAELECAQLARGPVRRLSQHCGGGEHRLHRRALRGIWLCAWLLALRGQWAARCMEWSAWPMGDGGRCRVGALGRRQRAPMENWRELALSIMSIYSERTNGSFVEQSSSGLAFVYGACDPEFGAMQAELHAHLSEVLEQEYAVELQLGPGRLHVQPKGVDKGGLLRQAIEASMPDFVLVLGDDHTDEPAFGALADWLKGSQTVQPSHGGGCTAWCDRRQEALACVLLCR